MMKLCPKVRERLEEAEDLLTRIIIADAFSEMSNLREALEDAEDFLTEGR
jgi:hypothetical protein